MICPICGYKTQVLDVKTNTEENEVRRRRKCVQCGYRFWTMEFEVERPKKGWKHGNNWGLFQSALPMKCLKVYTELPQVRTVTGET